MLPVVPHCLPTLPHAVLGMQPQQRAPVPCNHREPWCSEKARRDVCHVLTPRLRAPSACLHPAAEKTTCNVRVDIEKILGKGNGDPNSEGYNAAL